MVNENSDFDKWNNFVNLFSAFMNEYKIGLYGKDFKAFIDVAKDNDLMLEYLRSCPVFNFALIISDEYGDTLIEVGGNGTYLSVIPFCQAENSELKYFKMFWWDSSLLTSEQSSPVIKAEPVLSF